MDPSLRKRRFLNLLLVTSALLGGCTSDPAPGPWPVSGSCPQTGELPYPPYLPLLQRSLCDGPLLVTGDDRTDSNALLEAQRQLSAALRRTDLAETLRGAGALVAVFPRAGAVCELPYFADLAGTASCDAAGGLGGVPGRPASACSEKNLLGLGSDQFQRGTPGGESVCIHEIAHLVMNVGLEPSVVERIHQTHAQAVEAGRWSGTFAATNADEYFAELTQSYFSANPDQPNREHNGVNGAEALRTHDPDGFALMEAIYLEPADLR